MEDVNQLLTNSGIVKNRLKINAAINNAKRFLDVQKDFGSFDKFIWKFVSYRTIRNGFKTLPHLLSKTEESDPVSKELQVQGFKFVGLPICYAFM